MSLEYVSLVKEYAVLPAPMKIVLMEIADRANPDHGDTCWPSVENICLRTGYSRRTIQRRLRQLVDGHWLAIQEKVDNRGQHSNRYRLNVAKLRNLAAAASSVVSDLSETGFEPFEEEKNRLKTRGVTVTPPPCQSGAAQGASGGRSDQKGKEIRNGKPLPQPLADALAYYRNPISTLADKAEIEGLFSKHGFSHVLKKCLEK